MDINKQWFENEFRQDLEYISKYTAESLIRADTLGTELNFADGAEDFRKILEICRLIADLEFSLTPDSILKAMQAEIAQLKANLIRIEQFRSAGFPDPKFRINDLIQEVRNRHLGLSKILSEVIPLGLLQGNDNRLSKISAEHQILNQEMRQSIDEARIIKNELHEILSTARDNVASLGVSKYSSVFLEESAHHDKQATIWLHATIFGSIAICAWGVISLWWHPVVPVSSLALLSATISKSIVFTGLIYMTLIFRRNFNAHRHNAVLNRHRQNALQTFEAFVKAAGDDIQTKNAVLLQATETIFSNQQTGYLSPPGEPESSNRIIEIIKSIDPGKTS